MIGDDGCVVIIVLQVRWLPWFHVMLVFGLPHGHKISFKEIAAKVAVFSEEILIVLGEEYFFVEDMSGVLVASGFLFCGIGLGPVLLHFLLGCLVQCVGIRAILSELGSTSANEFFQGLAIVIRDEPRPKEAGICINGSLSMGDVAIRKFA